MALILALGPASGAHCNPAVTLADRTFGGMDTPTAISYIVAQVSGGIVGVVGANLMFDLNALDWSTKNRAHAHLVFAEGIATGVAVLLIRVIYPDISDVADQVIVPHDQG